MNKSSLKKAVLEAKEIEQAAIENAKRMIEESLAPKIDQIVKESIKELESDESEMNKNESNMINKETKELFETEETNPAAPVAPAPVAETPAEEVPSEESEGEVEIIDDEESDSNVVAAIEALSQKLDAVIAKIDGGEEAPAEEAPAEEEMPAEEAPAAEEMPAEEMPAAPAPKAGEVVTEEDEDYAFEIEDMDEDMSEYVTEDEDLFDFEDGDGEEEDDFIDFDINDLKNEINIIPEDEKIDEEMHLEEEEEDLDETARNKTHFARRMADQRNDLEYLKKENIAHYESIIDELNEENGSLKETIKEYKESFIVLRKQINEVQIFNAKLAYANKIFTNGGLTNDEKIRIAEEFDRVSTIEEAKKLYNTIISESTTTAFKNPADKLKTTKPALTNSTPSTKSETIFESAERKRMRTLAGIIKN
jgi:hypothetical protein